MTSSRNRRRRAAPHRTDPATHMTRPGERRAASRRRKASPAAATRNTLGLSVLAAVLLVATPDAQEVERYGERLSRMPVDLRTTSSISGGGTVAAELDGNELTVTVRVSGLSGGVSAAHVHNAPVARRGGVAFAIDIGGASGAAGEIVDTVTLTDDQLDELRSERYYVQIHTESNPGGELRGWLLRRDD